MPLARGTAVTGYITLLAIFLAADMPITSYIPKVTLSELSGEATLASYLSSQYLHRRGIMSEAEFVCHPTQLMASLMNALLFHLICCLAGCVWLVLIACVDIKMSRLEPPTDLLCLSVGAGLSSRLGGHSGPQPHPLHPERQLLAVPPRCKGEPPSRSFRPRPLHRFA